MSNDGTAVVTRAAPLEDPGNLFAVAAPSGAGKSSLVKALLAADAGLFLTVSHTTRKPRGQDRDGREYHFVDQPAFRTMIEGGHFVEWAEVHGNLYGTSKQAIRERTASGHDVLLEIDYQGALQIKQQFPGAVLVFILPPSFDELLARLQRRGEDDPAVIERRMANARAEVAHADRFDFVIINELFENALADLRAIVHAQRLKFEAQKRSRPAVFAALALG